MVGMHCTCMLAHFRVHIQSLLILQLLGLAAYPGTLVGLPLQFQCSCRICDLSL